MVPPADKRLATPTVLLPLPGPGLPLPISCPGMLPGLALAEQLYLSVQANGWEKKGTQALMLAL